LRVEVIAERLVDLREERDGVAVAVEHRLCTADRSAVSTFFDVGLVRVPLHRLVLIIDLCCDRLALDEQVVLAEYEGQKGRDVIFPGEDDLANPELAPATHPRRKATPSALG
jgi:hypothetical protein